MIGALLIGTVLAVGALAYVLHPVFFGVGRRSAARATRADTPQDDAIAALREIEFDRATGKLSDADYAELKARYTQEAVLAMRARANPPSDDELEAMVLAYRNAVVACRDCGPRPEADALFCSNCGRYLHDRCAGCGAPVEALDARYCVNCGTSLAA